MASPEPAVRGANVLSCVSSRAIMLFQHSPFQFVASGVQPRACGLRLYPAIAHAIDLIEVFVMALKPHVLDNQRREKKQRQYLAAPELAKAFPAAKEVVFEFRFVDPEGKVSPSPYKRIFTPEMQAFFDFPCPLKDCDGGGIGLSHTVARKLPGSRSETNQMQVCKGNRKREGAKGRPYPCGLEMHYRLSVIKKSRQAA